VPGSRRDRHAPNNCTHKRCAGSDCFRDLDDTRMAMATWDQTQFDYAGAAKQYAAAFARFGLNLQPGQPEAVAARIRAEEPAVREALLTAPLRLGALRPGGAARTCWPSPRAADRDAWRQGMYKDLGDVTGLDLTPPERESTPPRADGGQPQLPGAAVLFPKIARRTRWRCCAGRGGRHPADFLDRV